MRAICIRLGGTITQLHAQYVDSEYLIEEKTQSTIPNKNIMDRAATMDNPAPDNVASVKSLGIFLQTKESTTNERSYFTMCKTISLQTKNN